VLYLSDTLARPISWSPDGRTIFMVAAIAGQPDIYALPVSDKAAPKAIVASSFAEWDPVCSPDGRWLAYTSNESGQNEVYVIPLGRPGGKRQVSLDDGDRPRWRRDGREIFYLDDDDNIVAVQVDGSGDSFVIGAAQHLFEVRGKRPGRVYDVSGDGQTFLVNWDMNEFQISIATLVINWDQELKKQ
jgi:hypothetical protein